MEATRAVADAGDEELLEVERGSSEVVRRDAETSDRDVDVVGVLDDAVVLKEVEVGVAERGTGVTEAFDLRPVAVELLGLDVDGGGVAKDFVVEEVLKVTERLVRKREVRLDELVDDVLDVGVGSVDERCRMRLRRSRRARWKHRILQLHLHVKHSATALCSAERGPSLLGEGRRETHAGVVANKFW